MKIGFIGLGVMGRPMAGHLIAGGHDLFVHRVKPVSQHLVDAGAKPVDSAREAAAAADVVILMVPDTPDVEAVLFGPGGVAEGIKSGSLVIDMSSISPVATKTFAARLAEKGVDLPETPVDMMKREHKSPEHRARNSLGQVPTLELDDGTHISETVAICRYFEETAPGPSLFGRTAKEKANVDMWVRRIEFQLMTPVGNYWRHAHPRTAALLTQYKDFGESNRQNYANAQRWLDAELANRPFIAGEAYSMADICAQSTVDFAQWIGLELEPDVANLRAWRDRVSARPSANA